MSEIWGLRHFAQMRFTAVAALAVLTASCGKGRVAVYPVRGQVLVRDKPAVGAFVVFHPIEVNSPEALRPYGHVAADGSFTLTTYESGDGAPAGEYTVTVVWQAAGGVNEDPPDRLGGRYRDAKATKLRATVQQGPTELEPYRLTQ